MIRVSTRAAVEPNYHCQQTSVYNAAKFAHYAFKHFSNFLPTSEYAAHFYASQIMINYANNFCRLLIMKTTIHSCNAFAQPNCLAYPALHYNY